MTEKRLVNRMAHFIRTQLGDADNWRTLVHVEPNFDVVRSVRVDAIAIERGPARHFLHAHFVVTLEHRGKAKAAYGREQYKQLIQRHLPDVKNSYIHMTLMNSSTLNYAMKKDATPDELKTIGLQPSVTF